MSITGLHHITLVTANAQRNVDFYTRVLGLRLVKQTVNFDDPTSYHLYFGNETGAPGTAITFFEWPRAHRGQAGIGGTHHFALRVADYDALLQWKRYLMDAGIRVTGPLDRQYFVSLYFNDPDGSTIELATDGPGLTVDETAAELGSAYREPPAELLRNNRDEARIAAETWPEPVPAITPHMQLKFGMHHISAISSNIGATHRFLHDVLGLRLVKQTANYDDLSSAHWYWGVGDGVPGSLITYFERRPSKTRHAEIGYGQTHHYAFAVPDEDTLRAMREKLLTAGLAASPVRERVYFKSVYSRDPDGHIVEMATVEPGFVYDESVADLGQRLMLPPWLEAQRDQITHVLTPLNRTQSD